MPSKQGFGNTRKRKCRKCGKMYTGKGCACKTKKY